MSLLIYPRMLGYVATIVLHVANTVSMAMLLASPEAKALFSNPTVKIFNDMQTRYFTCWTFFLQGVYACVGLVCDILTLKNSHNKDYELNFHLRRLRDTLFSAIVWPSSLLVASVFWGLYHIDRDLIFPEILDPVLTPVSNHIIHTVIVPIVLWEVIFRPRAPSSHIYNLAHSVFYFVLYYSVVFYTYFVDGGWIYPIFKKAWGTIYFPIFMIITVVLFLVYYYIQWALTKLFHGAMQKDKRKAL